MHSARSRYISALALCSALALAAPPAASSAAAPAARFVGVYIVTQVGGAGVQRTELRLSPDGSAVMRTDFSRHTQRPVASAPVPPVFERGTWHEHHGRAVVHILTTSDDDAAAGENQRPQYSDLTFVLAGCLLRLVTSTSAHELEFSKRHCMGPA